MLFAPIWLVRVITRSLVLRYSIRNCSIKISENSSEVDLKKASALKPRGDLTPNKLTPACESKSYSVDDHGDKIRDLSRLSEHHGGYPPGE